MPAPDPSGLYIDEYDGGFSITCEIWWHGNRAHRIGRMQRIARHIKWGGRKCCHCGGPIPLFKRSDARYCRERCRKAAARQRRSFRQWCDQYAHTRASASWDL